MALKVLRFLAWLTVATLPGFAQAQDAGAQRSAARAALVIGNGSYPAAPIEGAVEGARAVAEVLGQGGFKVLYLENATKADIRLGLETLSSTMARGATGIIYYAGHAVQNQGRNLLIAVDSTMANADDVRREGIDLDLFLDPLLVVRTPGSAIIMDASRANPWQQLLPGNLRGLALPEQVKTISIVCSAGPNKVVGTGQAGTVFTTQLVQALKTQGISFETAINRTKAAVARINGKDQNVWQSPPLLADLVVVPTGAKPVAASKPADPVELGFWDTIKNSNAAADFQTYLGAYPNGQFALVARAKLAQLQPNAPEVAQNRQASAAPQAGQAAAQTQAVAQPQPAAAPAQVAAASPRPVETAPAAPPAPATPVASGPIRDCPVCPEMMLIPAGTMSMGSTEVFAFEAPVHSVTIAKPFYIGRREITFDEWDACLAEGGCQYRPGDRGQGRGLNPVGDLDWNDAKAYVAWLSKKTGKTYRLPTEAEWEYAARAGTKTAYYWGTAVDKDRANCAGCNTNPLNKTVVTGTFPPNAFGLFDMAGNAAEWVEDCWVDSYKSAPSDGSAYVKPECRERVLRGGSFNNDQRFVRTAARFKYDFDVRYYTNGFRVVRER